MTSSNVIKIKEKKITQYTWLKQLKEGRNLDFVSRISYITEKEKQRPCRKKWTRIKCVIQNNFSKSKKIFCDHQVWTEQNKCITGNMYSTQITVNNKGTVSRYWKRFILKLCYLKFSDMISYFWFEHFFTCSFSQPLVKLCGCMILSTVQCLPTVV